MPQKPDGQTIRQMLDDVEAVTRSRFYEDPDPVASPVEMFRMPEGKPGGEAFSDLSVREKVQVLWDYTPSYEERGISFEQIEQVFRNIVLDDKPREQWLDGTGLDGRPPAAPPTMGQVLEYWQGQLRAVEYQRAQEAFDLAADPQPSERSMDTMQKAAAEQTAHVEESKGKGAGEVTLTKREATMTKDDDYDPDWDLSKVRPVTRSLIEAITFDVWPTPAAANDFGIESQQHYEAIYYPARNDEISFAQLDAAYGNGPKLTELVNAAPSNPHKGIRFSTPWDPILGYERPGASAATSPQRPEQTMEEMQRQAAEQVKHAGESKDKGLEK